MPIIANYYITQRCNARCVFCDIPEGGVARRHEADTQTIIGNYPDLKRLGVKYLDLTGGEPLLREDLPELLRVARHEHRFFTTVTTNCILYPQRAKDLAKLVTRLNFSLDGPDAETHDRQRRVKCFDKVLESIELAHRLGESPILNYTITKDNYRRLPEMLELASFYKIVIWANMEFAYCGNEGSSQEMVDFVARYEKSPYLCLNSAALRFIRAGGNQIESPRCQAVTAAVVISHQNELMLPCYHMANARLPIDGNLYDLYRFHPVVQEHKAMQGKHDFCQGCTIWCYMNPSFLVKPDAYTLHLMASGGNFYVKHSMSAVRRSLAKYA